MLEFVYTIYYNESYMKILFLLIKKKHLSTTEGVKINKINRKHVIMKPIMKNNPETAVSSLEPMQPLRRNYTELVSDCF